MLNIIMICYEYNFFVPENNLHLQFIAQALQTMIRMLFWLKLFHGASWYPNGWSGYYTIQNCVIPGLILANVVCHTLLSFR